jgi:alcohol dehydrogenase class IV
MPSADDFTWRDGERTIVFRDGLFADALEVLEGGPWKRFELLTTPRALGSASVELAESSTAVHQVPGGPVPEAAAAIIDAVRNPTLVALGGGRVIDTAKAIAAVRGGRVCAMPTTLSGAEMTTIHRLPAGRESEAPHLVRPRLVLADPPEMTALPEQRLRASAMNALAHGAELIARSLDPPPARRHRAAHALDSAGFALHHVVCQTLVSQLSIPHAEANATVLPRTMAAMRSRAPEAIGSLAAALGTSPGRIQSRIQALGGGRRRLRDLGVDDGGLEPALNAILERPELAFTPKPPDRAELREILERAW